MQLVFIILLLITIVETECAPAHGKHIEENSIDLPLDWRSYEFDDETRKNNVHANIIGAFLRDINSARVERDLIQRARVLVRSRQGRLLLLNKLEKDPKSFVGAYVVMNQLYPNRRIQIPFNQIRFLSIDKSSDQLDLAIDWSGWPPPSISVWAAGAATADYWRSVGFLEFGGDDLWAQQCLSTQD